MTEYKVNADEVASRVRELLILARSVWVAFGSINEAIGRRLSDDDREALVAGYEATIEANVLCRQASAALPDDSRFKTLHDKARVQYLNYTARMSQPTAAVVEVNQPLLPLKDPPVARSAQTKPPHIPARKAKAYNRLPNKKVDALVQSLALGQPEETSLVQWFQDIAAQHGVSHHTVRNLAQKLGVKARR